MLWEKKLSSPLAVGILERLFQKPYVSVNDVAKEFSISFQAASNLVSHLAGAGILYEITGKKRDKRFLYREHITILSEGTGL
jgi:predicted transcriptional regulator